MGQIHLETESSDSTRLQIIERLQSLEVTASEQLIASLSETLKYAPAEVAGDTDSLLLGLLRSGSYTVDVLETATADPRVLLQLSTDSVEVPWYDDSSNRIDNLFESPTLATLTSVPGRKIETADLLRQVVFPDDRDLHVDITVFPIDREVDPNHAKGSLGAAMKEMIVYISSTLNLDFDARKLRRFLTNRRTPLSQEEEYRLDRRFGKDYTTMSVEELDFAIHAMNTWLLHRRVLTDPASVCLKLVATCAPLLYGPMHFAKSGGDLKILESCLDMARKFNPERDLNHLCLFDIDGRIQLGQYSYRNTVFTGGRIPGNVLALNLEAIRPSPFLSNDTIMNFERLLLNHDVSEPQIQRFLELHPTFFEAMGYVRAVPHVYLREDGRKDMIPDFILQLPGNRGFDILDLKKPSVALLSRDPYLRVSAEISKAMAQLKAYKDYFLKSENRKRFENEYGLEAFRPEICVVIGRATRFQGIDDRKTVEELMGETKLLTYDDIISYGKTRTIDVRVR